ncbi:polysaccharide deacetylase family protein [Paenibacillus sambharensis]|uniref:Polysaccharide deacetylase family protein n=1 Tax=Paenibacillus sambharensis TaxID=1803190 RepID=A0A2W1LPJ0_9BACL|nr:polysaccharide deacetylase family protein [Paenibacillus sambharensis]PZD96444.1 polysaccharide deacetylase family protein [Paenibacillus sambharensis]
MGRMVRTAAGLRKEMVVAIVGVMVVSMVYGLIGLVERLGGVGPGLGGQVIAASEGAVGQSGEETDQAVMTADGLTAAAEEHAVKGPAAEAAADSAGTEVPAAGGPSIPAAPSEQRAKQQPVDNNKRMALTFDDGPDAKYTTQVLDVLKEYNIKATFFVVGQQVERYPEVLRRIRDEGHEIGNHSFGHANLRKLSKKGVEREINRGDEAIQGVLGEKPALFRAPYGITPDTLTDVLKKKGKELVGWTIDTRDWAGTPEDEILGTVVDRVQPGGIVLMHSFGGKNSNLDNTIAALPAVIEAVQELGYSWTTVSGLSGE